MLRINPNAYLASPFTPVLPFLYQTRTLQAQLLSRDEKRVIPRWRAHRSFSSTSRNRATISNVAAHEIPFEKAASSSKAKGGSRNRSRKSDFRRLNVSRLTESDIERHLQFSPSYATASDSTIPHSTITASEKAAFNKLAKYIARSEVEEASSEDENDDEFIRELGDEFGSEIVQDIDTIFERSIERQSSLDENHTTASSIARQSSEAMRLEPLRKSHEKAFAKKLDSTETDIEVWTLLEKEVFRVFGELKERSKGKKAEEASHSVNKGKVPEKEQKKGTDSSKTSKDVLSVMQNNYSGYCLSALRLLRREFPRSPYVLHLLPTIKRFGPISYVLGATTALYNEILFVKWTQYSDLAGMADLVKEMLDKGVEINEVSIHLLAAVAQERQTALSADGDVNQATKTWWRLSGVQDSWDRVRLLLAASIEGLRGRRAREETKQKNDYDEDRVDSAATVETLHQGSDERKRGYEGAHHRAKSPTQEGASRTFHASERPRKRPKKRPKGLVRYHVV